MNLESCSASTSAKPLHRAAESASSKTIMGNHKVEHTICLTYLPSLPMMQSSKDSKKRKVNFCSHPCLKPLLEQVIGMGQDLSDSIGLAKEINKYSGIYAEVFKKPRWKNDSLILKLTVEDSETVYALKVHPDEFPLAKKIYSNVDLMIRVNDLKHTTKLHDVFLLGDIKEYWCILYEFIEGIPLKQAISEKKITHQEAFDKLVLMEKDFRKLKVFLRFPSDAFLFIKDECALAITDWSAIEFAPDITEKKWKEYDCSEFVNALLA